MITSGPVRRIAFALAAVLAACSQQPAPAPGARARVVVGELRAPRVTPGTQLEMVVPDAADGQSNHNPPGTVEVFSTAATAEDAGPANPCGARAVRVPVTIKSYATEQLENAMIEFTSIIPVVHAVCHVQPETKPAGATGSVIVHGTIDGSLDAAGDAPGGSASTTWWFNYTTGQPFGFSARVWADVVPAPPSNPSPATGRVYTPQVDAEGVLAGNFAVLPVVLTWTGETPDAHVEVWEDAAFATTLVEQADVACSGTAAPYACSYTVQSATGGPRHWRAVNRFLGSDGLTTVNGTFATTGWYIRDVYPTDLTIGDSPTNPYRNAVSAVSTAPTVDFYTWDWTDQYLDGEGNPVIRVYDWWNPYLYSTSAEFLTTVGTLHRSEGYDASSGQTMHFGACSQYGALDQLSTQGACTIGPDRVVP